MLLEIKNVYNLTNDQTLTEDCHKFSTIEFESQTNSSFPACELQFIKCVITHETCAQDMKSNMNCIHFFYCRWHNVTLDYINQQEKLDKNLSCLPKLRLKKCYLKKFISIFFFWGLLIFLSEALFRLKTKNSVKRTPLIKIESFLISIFDLKQILKVVPTENY